MLVANRIYKRLKELTGREDIEFGKLDITFYRDDFRMPEGPLAPHPNEINFIVTDKKVLLVDDVLYTGRTIQAALSALQHYGRPLAVELLVLLPYVCRQLEMSAGHFVQGVLGKAIGPLLGLWAYCVFVESQFQVYQGWSLLVAVAVGGFAFRHRGAKRAGKAYPGRGAWVDVRLEADRCKLTGTAVTVIEGRFSL